MNNRTASGAVSCGKTAAFAVMRLFTQHLSRKVLGLLSAHRHSSRPQAGGYSGERIIKHVWPRVLLDVLIFMSIFLLPWWAVLIETLVLFLMFRAPEGLFAGILLDALYPGVFFDVAFFFTFLFLLFFIGSRYVRRYVIIMYD